MKTIKKLTLLTLGLFLLSSCGSDEGFTLSMSIDPLEPTLNKLMFTLSDDGQSYIASSKQGNNEKASGPIVIPAEYEGKPVIVGYIGSPFITSVIVLDGVKTIRAGAFSNAQELKSISLPSSVTEIGQNIIGGTTRFRLEEISLPFVGSSKDNLLDFSYLYDAGKTESSSTCNQLKRVVINSNIASIANATFKDLAMLEEITLPNTITKIGDEAFSGCYSLRAFNNDNLKLTDVGEAAFDGCSALTSININWSHVKANCFYACTSLKSISFAQSTSIDEYAFRGCHLEELDLAKIAEVKSGAFSNNEYLKTISISKDVELASDTFNGSTSIKTVNIEEGRATLPEALLMNTSIERIKLPSSFKRISDELFRNCKRLQFVTIPAGLESIGRQVFSGISDLTLNYEGSEEQWNSITKDPLWDAGSTDLVVNFLLK